MQPIPHDAAALERYRLHADICKVLTDPKRLMLLEFLRVGERSVGELADAHRRGAPEREPAPRRPARCRARRGRRAGTTVTYRLAEPAIVDACDIVHAIVTRRLAAGRSAGRRSAIEPCHSHAIQR